MGDIDDGDVELAPQFFNEGQDLGPPRGIEVGQGLIHQQQTRCGEDGAADSDPLPLPTRQGPRPPRQQRLQRQQADHGIVIDPCDPLGHQAPAIGQISRHGHMGEQAAFLKNITQAPLLRRQIDTLGTVEQDIALHYDAALGRALQTGQHIDQGGLARARGAEQGGDPGVGPERRRDLEIANLGFQVHIQVYLWHHDNPIRLDSCFARYCEATRAKIARATDISARRVAPASPPGICRAV